MLLIISIAVHFAFLGYPAEVVFDEVHFGKFINSYFTGEYYFDIHPPLGKMLIAGFAKLCGYSPGFDFNHIGEMFDSGNLFILRFLPALFGALIPLAIYLILKQLKVTENLAFFGGLLAIFDNALLVQSKFILVDSMLLLFGFLSIYLYLLSQKNGKFLPLAALSAGLSLSIKWTGVLFLGIIGLSVIYAHLKRPDFKKLLASLGVLIFVPFAAYFLAFSAHFLLLPKSGPGSAYMSAEFQKSFAPDSKPMALWPKFVELNQKMYFYNSTLSAKHSFSSFWYQWPIGKRPIWYWAGSNANIYLMANAALWLAAFIGIIFSVCLIFARDLRKRMPRFFWFLLIGYFANLLPYITISRVTFLYHYLPSLLLGIIICSVLMDAVILPYISEKKGEKIRNRAYYGIISIAIISFLIIAPISYGMKMPEKISKGYSKIVNIFLSQ